MTFLTEGSKQKRVIVYGSFCQGFVSTRESTSPWQRDGLPTSQKARRAKSEAVPEQDPKACVCSSEHAAGPQ